jgi:hypothetical protein
MSISFTNPITIFEADPIALGSATPTFGGMVFLISEHISGTAYKIGFRWEPWSLITSLRAAQLAGLPVSISPLGSVMLVPSEKLTATHPVYGKEADPTQLDGGDMDIWNGEFTVIKETA